jgi:predicted nucleotidyltransferase
MKSSLRNKFLNIAKKFNLDFFVLFGSRANNTNREDSDWDFAFYRKKSLNSEEKDNLLFEIVKVLENDNIDLIEIDLVKTPPKLIYNILEFGEPIYIKNKRLFNSIRENIFFDYIDTENMFKELNDSYLNI